jgi:hypothetical protein
MSSSTKLETLIHQYGWNEIINDLVWIYQLENDKPIDSLPIVPMGHKFKGELDDLFHQVNKLCPNVNWKRDSTINHKTQYPCDFNGQLKNYHLNNVDFIITGSSQTTGNLCYLKIEKWENGDDGSTGLRYNIYYFFGQGINENYEEETFSSLKQVGDFITQYDSSTINI